MRIADDRLRQGLIGFILVGALTVTGCASTGQKNIKGPEAAKAAETEKAEPKEAVKAENRTSVEYINVVGDGDRVMIGTTGTIKYTVFRLSEPSRLIVDMPGVNLEKVSPSLAVNNDYVNEITAASYGDAKDIGRVVLALKEGIDYDVKAGENTILVSLKKPETAVDAGLNVEKAALVEKASPPEAVKEEAPAAELKQAAKIIKLDSVNEGENIVIKIKSDGLLGNYNTFELDTPSRVVIDVWDVESSIGKDVLKLNNKYIKTVRIGNHADKARFVFDGAGKKLPPHSIKRVNDSIILTLGPKVVPSIDEAAKAPRTKYAKKAEETKVAHLNEEKAAREAEPQVKEEAPKVKEEAPKEEVPKEEPLKTVEPAPPAEKPAPAPLKTEAPAAEAKAATAEDSAIRVEKIDFKRINGAGRLMIVNSGKAEFNVRDSQDGQTLIIDLKGVSISEELSRTLDAAKLNTPVATISSFQESVQPKAVRVLVKLKEKTSYNVRDNGETIDIEFSPAAAAVPPASAVEAKPEEMGVSKIELPDPLQDKKEFSGKKIDLDMMDANISDVLRLLAEISNLNIIASDDVKGTISLRLKNVPWDQAFDIILRSKDLDSVREGNVVRVAPALKIRQEKESVLASKKAQEKLENLEIHFIPINYASSADLLKQVQGVLSDRGTVTNDVRTNTIIVKDLKQGIDSARNLITKLDTPIPQVLIEARIIEASSSFARDLGIQWGLDYGTGGNTSTQTFGSSGTEGNVSRAQTPNSTIEVSGNDQYAVNLPASGTAGTLGALGFILGKAGNNPFLLDLRLSAGESEGRLKTISRPRITTMDNKEAKIEQGESIPFETTSSSGTSTSFIDANLSLTVTPHITPDGSVLMKIKASRNSIGTFRTSGGEPSINKKESSTEVLVRDGETTVIGGIVITDTSDTEQGIPYLMDIPVLGKLFRSSSVADSQTELLIFITPTIIKEKVAG
ncbi:MAG: type IV pilus secretin PilQ [Deltaproteobacteria bacterium]|nr:type IV pilus secretin PilQ [Deltaproteobacteria bacterium]